MPCYAGDKWAFCLPFVGVLMIAQSALFNSYIGKAKRKSVSPEWSHEFSSQFLELLSNFVLAQTRLWA